MTPREGTPPELLAPGGSPAAFLAALDAGADAVYFGLPRWSARARAVNLAPDDAARLLAEAHRRGRRAYAALNTLLRDDELPAALDDALRLADLGVDALIVQDLGFAAALRAALPRLPLHASTQATVHSADGARRWARLGVERVILARECTAEEIGAVRRGSGVAVEVFVHGALCFSVSGLCLASALLVPGRSANRGTCAQPCRWAWRAGDGGAAAHPFSPSDLALHRRLDDLRAAGVAALKIEGRLQGAEVVDAVVRAWRGLLDAPPGDAAARRRAADRAEELLAAVRRRPDSEGFLDTPRPATVLERGGHPAAGIPVGRVAADPDGRPVLQLDRRPHRGDRLRIQDLDGVPRGALVLREFTVRPAADGVRVVPKAPLEARPGDLVYRVKSAEGEALEQRLARTIRALPPTPPRAVDLAVTLHPDPAPPVAAPDGATAFRLEIDARLPGPAAPPAPIRVVAGVHGFPAQRRPLEPRTLGRHLDRMAGDGWSVARLDAVAPLPPVVIPPSAFGPIRRALASAWSAAAAAERHARRLAALARRGPALPAPHTGRLRLLLRLDGDALVEPGHLARWDRIEVPLDRDGWARRVEWSARVGPERLRWVLPAWTEPGEERAMRERLAEGVSAGAGVVVTHPAHLEWAEGLAGARLHAGRELHLLNGWTAAVLAGWGVRSVTVSPEADGGAWQALAAGGFPAPPVFEAWLRPVLFRSRLRVPTGPFEGPSGVRLWAAEAPLPGGPGPTEITADRPFDRRSELPALRALGVRQVRVDLTHRRPGDPTPQEAAAGLDG